MLVDLITIVWLHFVGDFLLQSDVMAKNKSSSNKWLLFHGVVYGAPLIVFGIWYYVVNVILHIMVDFFTSRATSILWANKKVHWFFVVIGLDQALHFTALFLTYQWLVINP